MMANTDRWWARVAEVRLFVGGVYCQSALNILQVIPARDDIDSRKRFPAAQFPDSLSLTETSIRMKGGLIWALRFRSHGRSTRAASCARWRADRVGDGDRRLPTRGSGGVQRHGSPDAK